MRLFIRIPLVIVFTIAGAKAAEVRGKVRDPSGAVVVSAAVVLTGQAGLSVSATSDSAGGYTIGRIGPGTYELRASAPGLGMKSAVTIRVDAGRPAAAITQDLTLTVQEMQQQVTVAAESGGGVSTEASENANSLTLRGSDLDALGDNPDDLQADLQALAGPSAGPNGGSLFVDGFSGGELPAKSAIREIRINQNPFSPEYDKLGYGRIDVFTKPGADKFRATIDYNLGTDVLDSRNPYAAVKPRLLLNEFEGEGGGPLGKKTSLSISGQRNTVDNGSISNGETVDPASFAIRPFSTAITTGQKLARLSPRVDHQLSENHTLTVRYGITHGDIRDGGVGAFDLISRGYHLSFENQTAQLGETAVVGAAVNEIRFQFYRMALRTTANSDEPQLLVLGGFNGGGSAYGRSHDGQNRYEFQDYASWLRGKHSLRLGLRLREQTDNSIAPMNFNGAFTFSSIESYQKTLVYASEGLTPAQARAMGGGAAQFTISAGRPGLSVGEFDAAVFAGDEWRVNNHFTVNWGARYEAQTRIRDWADFAPRVGVAWAPPATKGKMVVRGGFGIFYDRFPLAAVLAAERFNGSEQRQYVVENPDFFPQTPAAGSLSGLGTQQVVRQEISAGARAPYILQSALTVERQLPKHTTLAVTYTNSRGEHELRSNDINAPLPGTYNPSVASGGVHPFGTANPIFLAETSGVYRQNQLITNVNAKVSPAFSFFGFYVFNVAKSNTEGLGTFRANPYSDQGEYGPAATDVRHRFSLGGSLNTRWNVRLSPFLVFQTGAPFDITSGSDFYGTTIFNARPGFATDLLKPGVIATRYGLLDPNPSAGETIVPRNYGRGPDSVTLNFRITKTIGFGGGEKRDAARGGDGGSGAVNPLSAASGRGLGGLIGTPRTRYRYNLSFGLSVRNVLNHVNPGPIVGDVTSPLFGRSNSLGAPVNGEGFSENAANRRLEFQIRFAF